jgi:geranylgeranyl diphosphate synthase type II
MSTTELPPDLVGDTLSAVGRRIRRAMLEAIPDYEPHRWLYQLARSYPSRPSKALRPALCIAACRAFGGREDDVFRIAVAIEMLHNAFLIHDDIVDGSSFRRGRPTLPADHGDALALNAGDALVVLAYRVLRGQTGTMPPELASAVLEEFDVMALRTLEGQATELGWQRDAVTEVTPEDYLNLVMYKTCWYTTIHPLRVGALVGSGGSAEVRDMVRFGFYLGAAFQVRDDLLNLTADPLLYGKEINGDLYEGKRTLPLIHLVEQASDEHSDFVEAYLSMKRQERTAEIVSRVRSLLDDYGSLQFAAAYAQGIASAAFDAFDSAFSEAPPGPDVEFIRALIPYMLGRTS